MQVKRIIFSDFIRLATTTLKLTESELDDFLKRVEATRFEAIVGGLVQRACKGDAFAITTLFERMWGKVKDVAEITQVNVNVDEVLDKYDRDSILDLLRPKEIKEMRNVTTGNARAASHADAAPGATSVQQDPLPAEKTPHR